ncbi:hypothetical protein GE061_007934 [Apolygus lucorum]|uniref:Uncharacterized protein n=1 Tax=Apolygus lucorum TaxID=248454 RepID=A0A8S9WNB9_APOLU|nr:hypothetical protein GE061_007934 [Apolygus lucorum]
MERQPLHVWSHFLWSRHSWLRLLGPRGPTLPQVPAPPEIRNMVVRSQVAFPHPCFLEKPVRFFKTQGWVGATKWVGRV